MGAIDVVDVSKQFHLPSLRPRTLKEALVSCFYADPKRAEESRFWALRDISISIERGETFGIIGNNGSGKSTLLKLITNISKPTKGSVGTSGKISALLELGAGFHPEFSGRENIFLNAAILGLRRREVEKRLDSIIAFAELEQFIDSPVKTYSSGMYMRLAFSIAVNVDPDILVIDEVLAVGDVAFQRKCFDQIHRFKHSGKTIVFVSHSLSSVRDLCQRALWLDKGVMRAVGNVENVLDFYSQQIAASVEKNKQEVEALLPDGLVTVRNIRSFDEHGSEQSILGGRDKARFDFELDTRLPYGDLEVFTRILRTDGICCYDQRVRLAEFAEEAHSTTLSCLIPELKLNTGTYVFQLCITRRGSDSWLDEKFFNFAVESPRHGQGLAPLEAVWTQQPTPQHHLVKK